MPYRRLFLLVAMLAVPLTAMAHPESFHIIVDVAVTIVVQLIIFGLISAVARGRRCNDALWLGIYGATLVFAILATTQLGRLYPMWIVPGVLYVLMIIHCLKNPSRGEDDRAEVREADPD